MEPANPFQPREPRRVYRSACVLLLLGGFMIAAFVYFSLLV
jgi:hypothetical protein